VPEPMSWPRSLADSSRAGRFFDIAQVCAQATAKSTRRPAGRQAAILWKAQNPLEWPETVNMGIWLEPEENVMSIRVVGIGKRRSTT